MPQQMAQSVEAVANTAAAVSSTEFLGQRARVAADAAESMTEHHAGLAGVLESGADLTDEAAREAARIFLRRRVEHEAQRGDLRVLCKSLQRARDQVRLGHRLAGDIEWIVTRRPSRPPPAHPP